MNNEGINNESEGLEGDEEEVDEIGRSKKIFIVDEDGEIAQVTVGTGRRGQKAENKRNTILRRNQFKGI